MAKNRQLWKGNHDLVYGAWWRLLREDKEACLELVLNWHKRLSTLWADLMLSETPRFLDGEDSARSTNDAEDTDPAKDLRQETIDRLTSKDDNGYVRCLYKVALDVSRYGNGLIKLSLEKDGAQMWPQPPHYWFPVVDPNNLHKVTQHVLAWTFERNDMKFLRVEIHDIGVVQHRVYHLEGNHIGQEMEIATFAPDTPTGLEFTGVDDFLVVPFAGLQASDEIFGNDDYSDVDSIIMALEVRAGQINRVLDKHTDPDMYGPPDLLEKDSKTGKMIFKNGGRYYEVDEEDVPPGYVVWEGQLEAQFEEMDQLIKQLYIISETSPAAFGQIEAGLAESGSALRRLMQAPLAKVARITMTFDPAAKRCIRLAAQLERKNGLGTPEVPSVNIQWQDGLPPDPKEQAETEQSRKSAENTSTVSSIRRLDGGTQEEAEAEYERIQEEKQSEADMAFENTKREAALSEEPEGTPGKPGAVKPGQKK